jgi:hypothetical protein
MKRIYHNYLKWEDYLNGMWRKVLPEEEEEMLHVAIEFTGDHSRYGSAMRRVIKEWPFTCEHNITDNSINKKAFIGHCAVCIELGIPEYITRQAWGFLNQEQQDLANLEAENTIKEWYQSKQLKLF